MPHKSGPLFDPAAADAFITGYKRVLLRVVGSTQETGVDLLATLADARSRLVMNAAIRKRFAYQPLLELRRVILPTRHQFTRR